MFCFPGKLAIFNLGKHVMFLANVSKITWLKCPSPGKCDMSYLGKCAKGKWKNPPKQMFKECIEMKIKYIVFSFKVIFLSIQSSFLFNLKGTHKEKKEKGRKKCILTGFFCGCYVLTLIPLWSAGSNIVLRMLNRWRTEMRFIQEVFVSETKHGMKF